MGQLSLATAPNIHGEVDLLQTVPDTSREHSTKPQPVWDSRRRRNTLTKNKKEQFKQNKNKITRKITQRGFLVPSKGKGLPRGRGKKLGEEVGWSRESHVTSCGIMWPWKTPAAFQFQLGDFVSNPRIREPPGATNLAHHSQPNNGFWSTTYPDPSDPGDRDARLFIVGIPVDRPSWNSGARPIGTEKYRKYLQAVGWLFA